MSASMGKIVLTRLAAAVYSLAVLVMGMRGVTPTEPTGWLFIALVMCWCASPIVAGFWIASWIPGKLAFSGCFFAIVVIAAIGFAEQWHVLFVGPIDALNGLIMIVIPVYQWLATGFVLAATWLVRRHVLKP